VEFDLIQAHTQLPHYSWASQDIANWINCPSRALRLQKSEMPQFYGQSHNHRVAATDDIF